MDVVKRPRADDKAYGEIKKPRQFLITETASEMIDTLAERAGISRSEFIERSARWLHEHWDAQLQRDLEDDKDES